MNIIIGAIALGLPIIWLANGIRKIGAVSKGDPIGDRPHTAILMIDLQSVFWDGTTYSSDDKAKTQAAIDAELNANHPDTTEVIEIRQEWSIPSNKVLARLTMAGQAIAGTAGTETATPFKGRADHSIVKRVQDAFETGELDALLARLNVGTLRIIGLDAKYCVSKTVQAAEQRGYTVEIIRDAVLAVDQTTRDQSIDALVGPRVTIS